MNVKVVIQIALMLPFISLSQSLDKDTIYLKEVVINKSSNTPKLKTIKFGKGKGGPTLSLVSNPEVVYLIEDIPEGNVKELTIFFNYYRKKDVNNVRKISVAKSEYEVSFYSVGDDNRLGQKINDEPVFISLENVNNYQIKRVINLSSYNLYTKRFFIHIKRLSPLPCDECFLYLPSITLSNKKLWFYSDDLSTIKVTESLQEKETNKVNYQLRTEVKVLTQDY